MKQFGGPILFLDRSDINTDEIIPAKYLTEVKKDALQPHLLEDLTLDGFDAKGKIATRARVVMSRSNFGCGSSREHAPWALEVNDINVVVATSFARIFRQNMFNCGMLAIELTAEDTEQVFALRKHEPVDCQVDLDEKQLVFTGKTGERLALSFGLAEFDEALVRAGGWVGYADKHY